MLKARLSGSVRFVLTVCFDPDGMGSPTILKIVLWEYLEWPCAKKDCVCSRLYFSLRSRDEELSMSLVTRMTSPLKWKEYGNRRWTNSHSCDFSHEFHSVLIKTLADLAYSPFCQLLLSLKCFQRWKVSSSCPQFHSVGSECQRTKYSIEI